MEVMLIFAGIIVGGAIFSSPPEIRTEIQIRQVDIETYMDWGTTKMVPIGVRTIPSLEISIEEKQYKRNIIPSK